MDLSKYYAKENKTIKEHTDDVVKSLDIIKDLGYIDDKKIYALTKKACELHDIGKVNREFQKRIEHAINHKRMFFNEEKEIAHNILSIYFINKDEFEDVEDYYKVAVAVLNHHNYCDERKVISEQKELIESLLEEFEEKYDIKKRTLNRICDMIGDKEAIWIKGLLHRCDYSASAEMCVELENDFLNEKLDGLLNRWKEKDKSSEWRPLQRYCLEHQNDNIIVTAQTGMGKTEAGLLWLGDNKGFFVLPIRTAINAIYDRVRIDIIGDEVIDERVALLHSDSLSCYSERIKDERIDILEYYQKSKNLSMPLTITTMDQLFDFSLKYTGYEMKLVTLAYSKVIIDEIQMYGPDLLAYLIYGIKMINEFGGKVAILTATLAPYVRDLLVEKGFMSNVEEQCFIDDSIRHNVNVYDKEINADDIYEKYTDNINNQISNKILVICNTVKKAQELYLELQQFDVNVSILHNKFTKEDRKKKELEIIEFGKTYSNGKIDYKNGIWISTSLVEASLDIDFDYLFTELSELNGLFQRMGRCNRKGVKDTSNANCFVYTKIDKGVLRHGSRGFIDKSIHELSIKAIKEVDGILSESKKVELINKYITTENMKNSTYVKEFEDMYDYLSSISPNEGVKADSLRNIFTELVIPECIYNEHYDDLEDDFVKLNETRDLKEIIEISENILKYTLSIESYYINGINSLKVINKKNVGNKKIYVVDCYYDEVGFRKKDNDGFNFL